MVTDQTKESMDMQKHNILVGAWSSVCVPQTMLSDSNFNPSKTKRICFI
jgi:hypothetical protein